MTKSKLLRRFLIPAPLVRFLYYRRHRALIAPHAEVEYAPTTDWGPGCVISSFSKVKVSGPFRMGRCVHIATGCCIVANTGGLEIGDDVLIGPNCAILTSNYSYTQLGRPLPAQGIVSKGVRIGHRVWIGANSVVLDGTQIADDVIVAAGSVVSGSIPANSIVQGNPARVIFTRR